MYKIVDTVAEVKDNSRLWKVHDLTQIFIQGSEKDSSISRLCDVATYEDIKATDTIKTFSDLNRTYIETWQSELVYCKEDETYYSATNRIGKKGEEVAQILLDFVNGSSNNYENFAEAIVQSHRTLQQCIFKLFTVCLKKWASYKEKNWYDDRNKATIQLSSKLWDEVKDEYIPFI